MIKLGVDLRGLVPQMSVAYTIAAQIYAKYGTVCVITSGSDGTHGPNSLHYQGKAMDLRTNNLMSEHLQPVYASIKTALGEQFDVVLEANHLHIEFDPKEPPKAPET